MKGYPVINPAFANWWEQGAQMAREGAKKHSGAYKVGDPITQGGQKYKVTAVDANGKVTAAEPIE